MDLNEIASRIMDTPSHAQVAAELEQLLEAENQRLKADLATMTKDRDEWKREWQMYADAWLRELGGRLVPKSHRIDALVITTRRMKETHDRLVREEAERKRAADVAEYGPFVQTRKS